MADGPVAAMETVSFSLKSITDALVETDVVPAILTAAMAIAPESVRSTCDLWIVAFVAQGTDCVLTRTRPLRR